MFSHILVGTDDVYAAKKFNHAVLGTINIRIGDLNEAS